MININDTFGIYTVKEILDERTKDGHRYYIVECNVCHQQFKRTTNHFATLNTVCTKCQHEFIKWKTSNQRLHKIWFRMKNRCYNPSSKDYRFYGAKGITITQEWLDNPILFEEWSYNNGYTDELTIDRIDSSQGYTPDNCRWITASENSRFKSTTNYIEINGEIKSGRQWSKILNKSTNYINTMIRNKGLEYTIQYIKNELNKNKL